MQIKFIKNSSKNRFIQLLYFFLPLYNEKNINWKLIIYTYIHQFTSKKTPVTIAIMYGNNNNKGNNYKGNNKDKDSKDNKGKKGEEYVFRGPFSSNVMGLPIVNAITGVKYPWTVGSFEENHLWKVVNCTRFTPMTYFYDSPEQHEAHKRVTIDPESKAAWYTLQRNLEWSVLWRWRHTWWYMMWSWMIYDMKTNKKWKRNKKHFFYLLIRKQNVD